VLSLSFLVQPHCGSQKTAINFEFWLSLCHAVKGRTLKNFFKIFYFFFSITQMFSWIYIFFANANFGPLPPSQIARTDIWKLIVTEGCALIAKKSVKFIRTQVYLAYPTIMSPVPGIAMNNNYCQFPTFQVPTLIW